VTRALARIQSLNKQPPRLPSGSAVHHGRRWGGKAENKVVMLPDGARWVVPKARNGGKLTDKQSAALAELEAGDFLTA
jgi:hypothetical protein